MNEQPGTRDRKHEGVSAEAEVRLSRAEAVHSALLGDKQHRMEANDEIVGIFQSLQSKYPDWQECAMMHVLASSGMMAPPKRVDFEGEDSILSFLEDLARRMNVKV